MKEIKAFIHRHRISAVIEAIKGAGFAAAGGASRARNISVASVQSLLPAIDAREQRYSLDLGEPIIQEYKVELLCDDGDADSLVKAVARAGRTGQEEAGWIYVTDVGRAVQIGSQQGGSHGA